ncbi:YafY family protein [Nocardia seriolae]|nr:YafY family protein [Nocardia seriolae]
MRDMGDTTVRLLRLLSLLQSRRRWTGDELAERLGVSARTIRADINRLRALDYGVDASPGVAGGYRLRAGVIIPPLHLDDDEAVATAVGLHTAATVGMDGIAEHAARAAAKLERLLPSRLRNRLQTISAAIETVPCTRELVAPEVFQATAAAIDRREQLRFDYTDRHRSLSRRHTEPHRMVHVSGRWYLIGYDLDRRDWRTYRVDRITPKTPTGPRFTPRPLPGADLADFVTRGRMAAMWAYVAQIFVNAPVETVAARIPTGIWSVRPLDRHTSIIEAGAQTPQLLAAYLAAMDLDFHIDTHASPELATEITKLAARYAAATRKASPPTR